MVAMLQEHWNQVYRTKAPDSVSWYQPTPEPSLRALDELRLPVTAALVDVGGGASSLVDRLLERGWSDLTVVDIAAPALDVTKARLGPMADRVRWEVADVTAWHPGRTYDVWHDRAVFHFLTEPADRHDYLRRLADALTSDGAFIVATFAPHGPDQCSGLPVSRYDAESLGDTITAAIPRATIIATRDEDHTTPAGATQPFTWIAGILSAT
jgi:SAM-dependent methyltransferase